MGSVGAWMIPTMNVALLAAVWWLMPRCLGGPRGAWWVATLGVAAALVLPDGWISALGVLPFLGLTVARGVSALRSKEPLAAVRAGFAGVAASALLSSRLGWSFFGSVEPIVKLTALHFSYAGVGTLTLAWLEHQRRPTSLTRLALACVLFAPPVVALGFVFRSALGQVGGAGVMTAGVWLVAGLQLQGLGAVSGLRRVALLMSSGAPLVAMVLGLSWAAAQYWPQVPSLSVPDMVPTHGALNAFGFVLLGLWAHEGGRPS